MGGPIRLVPIKTNLGNNESIATKKEVGDVDVCKTNESGEGTRGVVKQAPRNKIRRQTPLHHKLYDIRILINKNYSFK